MHQFFIPTQELVARRSKLVEQMTDNSTLIIFANTDICRNSDTEYPFRQDSNFWYFTGINQSDGVLVIQKTSVVTTWVFSADKIKTKEIWSGKKLSKEEVSAKSGLQNVFWLSELDWTNFEPTITVYQKNKDSKIFGESLVLDLDTLVSPLRTKKSDWEIRQMQIASNINVKAHLFALQNHKSGNYEYQFEADLLHYWKKNGLTWSYPPIVASGPNATTLHYVVNDQICKDGDLLLVDAGCEVNYYASDITRCYPNSGKFSPAQREIYELVLDCNKQLIEFLKTKGPTHRSYHQKSVEILTQGLIDLKIIKSDLKTAINTREYTKFYMHGVGHWLGLDVHDLGNRDTVFEIGSCVTVEPGLYFDDVSVPEKYRGIGIRIEDDIAITSGGILNLTESLPKEIAQIEALMTK